MKYIYLYTTETYQAKNWYKIGETTTHPNKRIQHQDNASNPEPLLVITFWQVSKNISDKKVHSELEALGYPKLRGNREWFELSSNPASDIEAILTELGATPESVPLLNSAIKDLIIPNYQELWWAK